MALLSLNSQKDIAVAYIITAYGLEKMDPTAALGGLDNTFIGAEFEVLTSGVKTGTVTDMAATGTETNQRSLGIGIKFDAETLGKKFPFLRFLVMSLFGKLEQYYGIHDLGLDKGQIGALTKPSDSEADASSPIEEFSKKGVLCCWSSCSEPVAKSGEAMPVMTDEFLKFRDNMPLLLSSGRASKALKDKRTPLLIEACSPNPNISKHYPVGVALWYPTVGDCSTTDTMAVSAFSSIATTSLMSQAVPFLDIRIMSNQTAHGGSKRAPGSRPFSLERFLSLAPPKIKPKPPATNNSAPAGSAAPAAATKNKEAAPPATKPAAKGTAGEFVVDAGMESFLSPQIMGNPLDIKSGGDPFKSFLSIMSFSCNVRGIGGFSAEKTAILKLMLHDKSKMNLVAPLISADGYGTIRLGIEYGWSHPGSMTQVIQNPAAKLVDSMKTRETYQVVSSGFNIEESQVSIDLNLSLLNTNAVFELDITESVDNF